MDKQYPVRQWAHGADLVVSQLGSSGGTPGVRHPRRQNRQGLRFNCWIPPFALFRYATKPT
ncbi:hypothetical protein CP995_24175, partial [Klebsiella pneumoniae]